MPRRRLIGIAGALLAWLVAAGCGSSSTPAAKPAAGFSSPASPALAGPAIEGVASPKPIQAEAPTVPSRAPVLTISPEAATITADDPGVQLLLRRQSADGTVRDLTGLAGWRVDPPGSAAIEAGGYLRPLAAGKVVVKAAIEGQEVVALINVEPRENRSWDFASDVVPILTRLGCNTGSCHGRADGQNGFHLSLSGYDPDGDYQSLVREGAGPATPQGRFIVGPGSALSLETSLAEPGSARPAPTGRKPLHLPLSSPARHGLGVARAGVEDQPPEPLGHSLLPTRHSPPATPHFLHNSLATGGCQKMGGPFRSSPTLRRCPGRVPFCSLDHRLGSRSATAIWATAWPSMIRSTSSFFLRIVSEESVPLAGLVYTSSWR